MVKECLLDNIMNRIMEDGMFDREVTAILEGRIDPYTATESLVRNCRSDRSYNH